jgi:hypothetical protein
VKSRQRIVATLFAVASAGALIAAPRTANAPEGRFPHQEHANLFPLCSSCHAGVVERDKPVWPDPVRCTACHDGTVEKQVSWEPRTGPRPGNRRFTHFTHDSAVTAADPADSAMIRDCGSCHNATGAIRMAVRNAVVEKCLSCHGIREPHVDAPSRECATCHVRLTEAPGLTRDDIARFPRPASHDAPGFLLGGHGALARPERGSMSERGIAASCATCHARNLCLACHVNAAESPVIAALEVDERAPLFLASQPVPPTHREPGFLRSHGRDAQRATASCATCHTRESCTTCHIGSPARVIAALPVSGPGRAAGAMLTRTPPPSHTLEFRDKHGAEAASRPKSCETCHVRSSCLQCHRPDVAGQNRYHSANFLTRHPSAAYSREASCSDCHNPAQFCQACHQQSGLVAAGRIGTAGYHDAFRGFSLGHGQAARQSLESCASCHAERDCTACHSAVAGGFRFNPHGPGFNPTRARAKNPTTCIACHGRTIPGGP